MVVPDDSERFQVRSRVFQGFADGFRNVYGDFKEFQVVFQGVACVLAVSGGFKRSKAVVGAPRGSRIALGKTSLKDP